MTRQPVGTLVCEHVKSKDVTLLHLYGSWVALLLPLPAQATLTYDRMGKFLHQPTERDTPNQNLFLEKLCGIDFMPLFMDWMKIPRAFRFQSALCLPASLIPPA